MQVFSCGCIRRKISPQREDHDQQLSVLACEEIAQHVMLWYKALGFFYVVTADSLLTFTHHRYICLPNHHVSR